MTEALEDLKHLRDLAHLEGYTRLTDLETLLGMARVVPDRHQDRLLEVARALYAGERAPAVRLEPLTEFIALLAHPGLISSPYRDLDAQMDLLLTALEDAHRQAQTHPLDEAIRAALQALKDALFGRPLNIAERSRLRGFYEREKLLRRW